LFATQSNQHSGGVKFVELLAEVVAAKFEGGWTGEAIDTDSFPEILEQAIEKMPGVEILRYGWQMDDELKRGEVVRLYPVRKYGPRKVAARPVAAPKQGC
jgi:hypothetical protein